jgi:ATP-dependent Lon protease
LTLSGRILPVGGVKEKALAAHRAGVTSVVFPDKNEADIRDIPEDIQKDLKILKINELEEIIDVVLN